MSELLNNIYYPTTADELRALSQRCAWLWSFGVEADSVPWETPDFMACRIDHAKQALTEGREGWDTARALGDGVTGRLLDAHEKERAEEHLPGVKLWGEHAGSQGVASWRMRFERAVFERVRELFPGAYDGDGRGDYYDVMPPIDDVRL